MEEILKEEISKSFDIHEWAYLGKDAWSARGIFRGAPEEASERLAKSLIGLGFYPLIRKGEEEYHEVVILKTPPKGKNRVQINIILFLLTLLTTLLVGTLQSRPDLWRNWGSLVSHIYVGIPFSSTLLLILGMHEFGHYFFAKRHRVDATLPYFIPFPHPLVGTLGAFIKIRSPIPSRKALMDIGIAGPLAGALIALPLTAIGLRLSTFLPIKGEPAGLLLGDSILFRLLSVLFAGTPPDGYALMLHPMAFAGWLGFFITALNLIPIGQLDGGHISYAMLGRKHRVLARASLLILILLGFKWLGWWTWAFIVFFLGLDHPSPLNEIASLDRRRKTAGIIAFILLLLTFIPAPFLSP